MINLRWTISIPEHIFNPHMTPLQVLDGRQVSNWGER